jgi:hypothetical protein
MGSVQRAARIRGGAIVCSSVLVGAVLLLAVSAAASVSPAQLLSSSLAAARAQRSVHYVAAETSPISSVTMVGDAAVDRGIQRITYRKGSGVGHVTVTVVANTAYLRGDAFALTNYMGFPAAAAAAYAGKWLSVAPTATYFRTLAAAVRLQSTLDELKMPGPLRSVGNSTVLGQSVAGVRSQFLRSGKRVTETLYVRTTGSPLPVEQVAAGGTIRLVTTMGGWNEVVHVSAPRGAIPLR